MRHRQNRKPELGAKSIYAPENKSDRIYGKVHDNRLLYKSHTQWDSTAIPESFQGCRLHPEAGAILAIKMLIRRLYAKYPAGHDMWFNKSRRGERDHSRSQNYSHGILE